METPGRSNHMINARMDEDYPHFNSEAFIRELEADLNDHDNQIDGSSRIPDVDRIPVVTRRFGPAPSMNDQSQQSTNRPTLSNKNMLKGLIERGKRYNTTVDRRVMTDARIAIEEEQWRTGRGETTLTNDPEVLSHSSQNTQKKGRGDYFGRMRSAADSDINYLSKEIVSQKILNNNTSHFNNNDGLFKQTKPNRSFHFPMPATEPPAESFRYELSEEEKRCLAFKPPRRFGSRLTGADGEQEPPIARHHFNPETAYKGIITPDYRFNYNPQATMPCPHVKTPPKNPYSGVFQPVQPALSASFRPGQRYPKRPDNNPSIPPVPKQLNHNYYNIELYGATQDEKIAMRIEKTVRQTETPIRRF